MNVTRILLWLVHHPGLRVVERRAPLHRYHVGSSCAGIEPRSWELTGLKSGFHTHTVFGRSEQKVER
jgi:hypothetical protein